MEVNINWPVILILISHYMGNTGAAKKNVGIMFMAK